jgi:hypothetical protein
VRVFSSFLTRVGSDGIGGIKSTSSRVGIVGYWKPGVEMWLLTFIEEVE